MARLIIEGLDFETRCAVSIADVGLHNYVNHPTFQVLLAALDDGHGNSFDFVHDRVKARNHLMGRLASTDFISAHNVMFEILVLRHLGINVAPERFIDSAVVSRQAGAESKLEYAAPQLLGVDKMPDGRRLIRKFSIGDKPLTRADIFAMPDGPADWDLFQEYCKLDARLARQLAENQQGDRVSPEDRYERLTREMNLVGWPVDVESVRLMQDRFEENKVALVEQFRATFDPTHALNFNSPKQLTEWCAIRGVRTSSFAEDVVKRMITSLEKKLQSLTASQFVSTKSRGYWEVLEMLRVKQQLGGSSLSKLQVILDTVGDDGRLRHQYMHYGAQQTGRSTGRGVQLQNLKRLHNVRDLEELKDDSSEWTNTEMAENLRQVFTASDPRGALIVGDFSSVESRALAFLAGETWKLEAYEQGQPLYELLAAKIFAIHVGNVSKDERAIGKVGELGCGYQAGPQALADFALKMGVPLDLPAATDLVRNWRDQCPRTVDFWARLQEGMESAVRGKADSWVINPQRWSITMTTTDTPDSLSAIHPGAQSIAMYLFDEYGSIVVSRVIHGCYFDGRDVHYYKAAGAGQGLWNKDFMNPKTKQRQPYNLYGGKLTGILVQSMCRELFFQRFEAVAKWASKVPEIQLVGQFHDELVLEVKPSNKMSDQAAKDLIENVRLAFRAILTTGAPAGLPLDAKVEAAYRYTK